MKFLNRNKRVLLSFLTICVLINVKLYAGAITDSLDQLCQRLGVNGLSVAVLSDSSTIFTYEYGVATHVVNGNVVEDKLKQDDLWRVASVTKNVIAVAIMKLNEDGFLNIGNDIGNYLPETIRSPYWPDTPITVEMLLSHRSGIDNANYFSKNYKGIEFLECKPGTKYKYSNVNYLVLAQIIENVTKCRFDRYIESNILRKIDVVGTFNPYVCEEDRFIYGHWYDSQKNRNVLCDSYRLYDKQSIENYEILVDTKELNPAGGLIITKEDLSRYVIMMYNDGKYNNRHVISENSCIRMRKSLSKEIRYGLGTIDYSGLIKGEKLYGHTGYSMGVFSCIVYNPEKKYGFVILCDGADIDYPDAFELLHAPIIKMLYDSLF